MRVGGVGVSRHVALGVLRVTAFFVFCPIYFGGGAFYNFKVKGKRGAEMVPNLEFWQSLPGLVKDGCKFSWAQTQVFIAKLRGNEYSSVSGAGDQFEV